MTVLVISCPHALGLAIPLVIAISTAVSARQGILIKDRLALERMQTVDTMLFDKTGTLTKGGLAPIGFTLAPAAGAILMSVSTVVVALNAQLLRRIDVRPGR